MKDVDMYRPTNFAEDRPEVLLQAVRGIGLATLVTPTSEDIVVTHAPVVARLDGERMVLETHVARANSHWRAASAGASSVAIFQGPHSYVTPSWYPSKAEHGKVVPTWSYISVHAHGPLEAVEDGGWLRRHLEELSAANEAGRDRPWKVSDAPETFVAALTRGIVGLRMTAKRVEGAWKMNQHKAEADREGTRMGLAGAGPMGAALAEELAGWGAAAD